MHGHQRRCGIGVSDVAGRPVSVGEVDFLLGEVALAQNVQHFGVVFRFESFNQLFVAAFEDVERVVRVGEELARPLKDCCLRALQLRIQLRLATFTQFPAGDPQCLLRHRAGVDALLVAFDLCPDEGLHPVHPGRTQFQGVAHAVFRPGATTDPVTRLKDLRLDAHGL